ncbi:hypothetical protein PEX2_000280 [Penicillium expansum]|uniref:Uncharacterized protein n=1 Tax=Penicillium expansum TaxID=27334 RepID=A0A0A2ILS6_PENEN|nr:hypothetical protein PEX2_000280 [Penicillium expansum]KGO43421.1 hypothetical protein PEXP_097120 [Penicillium expansum]KGO57353.1 hypothetical protein PEX2_000280 [Penicillium expansum]
MATHPFCCTTIQPTKPPNPDHEQTFTEFTKWGLTTIGNLTGSTDPSEASVCIQLVRQVNSGPIESIRYFVASDTHGSFEEVPEDGIVDANFVKMNDHGEDQDQEQNQNQDREGGISQSGDGTEINQDSNDDQPISSSPTFDTEVTQDEDAGSNSPGFETQATAYDEDRGTVASRMNRIVEIVEVVTIE